MDDKEVQIGSAETTLLHSNAMVLQSYFAGALRQLCYSTPTVADKDQFQEHQCLRMLWTLELHQML